MNQWITMKLWQNWSNLPRWKPFLLQLLQRWTALVWPVSAQSSQIVINASFVHWITALFLYHYLYAMKDFHLPYYWRLHTKFPWGIFMYALFIRSSLQLIVRNWVVLRDFMGHMTLLLYTSKMYIVILLISLCIRLLSNLNLAPCQYPGTNKNVFSDILAT